MTDLILLDSAHWLAMSHGWFALIFLMREQTQLTYYYRRCLPVRDHCDRI